MPEEFTRRVHDAVRRIPPGRVAAYGAIAAIAGRPRSARAVGRALRELPDGSDVPWWRVINARGEISILNRQGLEDAACECYAAMRVAYRTGLAR